MEKRRKGRKRSRRLAMQVDNDFRDVRKIVFVSILRGPNMQKRERERERGKEYVHASSNERKTRKR